MNEKLPVNNRCFHFEILQFSGIIMQGTIAQLVCVSATRQHKGNKKLGATPTGRINKPNKTEINDSESFQVQTTAVMQRIENQSEKWLSVEFCVWGP